MLQTTRIFAGTYHAIMLQKPGASVQLLDYDGRNLLFYLGLKSDNAQIVVNDRINGTWGNEVKLNSHQSDTSAGRTVFFKFNGNSMEVWNSEIAVSFDRFDKIRCDQVALAGLFDAESINNSLSFKIATPEFMEKTITNHVLLRRLEALERNLGEE